MQGIIFYHIRSLNPVATAGNTLAIHLIFLQKNCGSWAKKGVSFV